MHVISCWINQKQDGGVSRRAFLLAGSGAVTAIALGLRYGIKPIEAKAGSPKTVNIVEFSNSGQRQDRVSVPMILKTDAEWKQQLSPSAYEIARQAGTERPYSGQYWNLHDKGLYRCVCCDTALFNSDTKFESGTGWPSFWQPIAKENVRESIDMSLGMERTEVACRRCDAHLGHVFDDGPNPTGLRYCMNSVALNFVKFA
jgi:peptide-methionine (R)-S-oxide reductase